MLEKNILRSCVLLVLGGLSISFATNADAYYLYRAEAFNLIDENGHVEVPDTVVQIGSSAFTNSAIRSISIPDTVTHIQSNAFQNTPLLKEVILPNSIIHIGEEAFRGSAIQNINFPEGLQEIERWAFAHTNLTNVTLPNSISTFHSGMFYGSPLEYLKIQGGPENLYQGIPPYSFGGLCSTLKILELNPLEGRVGKAYSSNPGTSSYASIPYANGDNSGAGWYLNGYDFSGCNLDLLIVRENVNNVDLSGLSVNDFYIESPDGSSVNVSQDILINTSGKFYVSQSGIGPTNGFSPTTIVMVCEDIDFDSDGYRDCIDKFPFDAEKWNILHQSEPEPVFPNDFDGDGILNTHDNDPSQNYCYEELSFMGFTLDTDQDGVANREDCDDDNDGLFDIYEPFFGTNPLIPDSDFDGTLDGLDAFPLDNTESLDTDSDGIGNNTDTDDDNDGHFDLLDAFPLDANEWMDSDSDGIGNNADPDDDNDGVSDDDDAFPYTASESVDTDGDGVGDNSDAFPNDSSETVDTDLDGVGNNADEDDDNDGIADADDSDPLNDAIGALESQSIFVMGNPVAVNGYITTISVGYDVSDANAQLTGIGYRVHYDSSIFSLSEIQNALANSIVVDGFGPYQDVENFDNDNTTDSYITFAWASVGGDWPNVELPAQLADINLFVNWANYEAGSTTSNINFSFIDNAQGYEPKATNYEITVLPATWDFDGDGVADALSDGLMMLRYAFGIQTLDLTVDAISTTATLTPVQIVDSMHRAAILADIDGDDSTDALTDGLLLLRYLFGLRGESLINGVVSFDATRTTAEEIEEYIELYMPDGSGVLFAFDRNFLQGNWKVNGAEFAEQENILDTSDLEWQIVNFDENYFSCSLDDIYTFDADGSFSYNVGSGTYNFIYYSSLINPHNNLISEGICSPNVSPYDASNAMSFELNESESKLTLSGKGAYILWPDIANGIDIISEPHLGPDQVVYEYSKLSDNEIQLYIQGVLFHSRFVLERVLQN